MDIFLMREGGRREGRIDERREEVRRERKIAVTMQER
jgi:hypothetical protein